jgi:hypothetical protein
MLKQLGPRAYAGSLAEAARFGEVTLFSVYWPHFQIVLDAIGRLENQILIDTINPLKVDETYKHVLDLELLRDTAASLELQKRLPKVRVVKAFSTLAAPLLEQLCMDRCARETIHSHCPVMMPRRSGLPGFWLKTPGFPGLMSAHSKWRKVSNGCCFSYTVLLRRMAATTGYRVSA